MKIIDIIKRKVLGYKSSSQDYIEFLRKNGASVGEDVVLFRPFNTTIDVQNPHLLSIGNHVMMTGPVTILTHDYSWSVIKRKYGCVVGNQKQVIIGDNVFIGWGTTILAGTEIGSNVIIGANSVVSGKVMDDSVYAGNPAKFLMSLDEYYKKRKENQLREAKQYVKRFIEVNDRYPRIEELDEYFFLFTRGDNDEYIKIFDQKMILLDNYEASKKYLREHEPMFCSYEEFIEYVVGDVNGEEDR